MGTFIRRKPIRCSLDFEKKKNETHTHIYTYLIKIYTIKIKEKKFFLRQVYIKLYIKKLIKLINYLYIYIYIKSNALVTHRWSRRWYSSDTMFDKRTKNDVYTFY